MILLCIYLDLSEVEKGIIKRDARFGYVEIPDDVSLKEAIKLPTSEPYEDDSEIYIKMRIIQTFELITGKPIEPYQ